MSEFDRYLEEQNGGPLQLDLMVQTSLYYENKSVSEFDLYEVGAVKDHGTYIDPEWRRTSRPKRIRPKSTVEKETKKLEKKVTLMDGASFDTSSHHTIDYLLEVRSSKSYNFG